MGVPYHHNNVFFSFFMVFWNDDKKGRNLTSGVRFSESARSIFSLWVQNKRVIEKGWNFDKKCFFKKRWEFGMGGALER